MPVADQIQLSLRANARCGAHPPRALLLQPAKRQTLARKGVPSDSLVTKSGNGRKVIRFDLHTEEPLQFYRFR